MGEPLRPVWAVNLGNFKKNLEVVRQLVSPGRRSCSGESRCLRHRGCSRLKRRVAGTRVKGLALLLLKKRWIREAGLTA